MQISEVCADSAYYGIHANDAASPMISSAKGCIGRPEGEVVEMGVRGCTHPFIPTMDSKERAGWRESRPGHHSAAL